MTQTVRRPVGIRFDAGLREGRLLRRYQRFLADVELSDGTTVTAHCPNTGAMLGCQAPDSRVWLSPAARPGRRCPFTWELVEVGSGTLVGIHTGRTNQLAAAAVRAGMLAELLDYTELRPEVRVPSAGVRFDFLLRGPGLPDYYLEVKNVTAAVTDRRAVFPDAISERASRHARELAVLRRSGCRAGVLFCAQRADVDVVEPADDIDPAYGRALRAAAADGVDVMAVGASVTPEGIWVDRRIPVALAA
ncbi:MAG: DNA/RNA nuclease SfsA [Gammaproteobacteria bacterium]